LDTLSIPQKASRKGTVAKAILAPKVSAKIIGSFERFWTEPDCNQTLSQITPPTRGWGDLTEYFMNHGRMGYRGDHELSRSYQKNGSKTLPF